MARGCQRSDAQGAHISGAQLMPGALNDYFTVVAGPGARERLLRTTPYVLSTLSIGDAAIYDSRLLHCGGANRAERPRVLLYFSFPSALHAPGDDDDFCNVASIRPEYMGRLSLSQLRKSAKPGPA